MKLSASKNLRTPTSLGPKRMPFGMLLADKFATTFGRVKMQMMRFELVPFS